MGAHRRVAVAGVLVAAVLLAACGSTVDPDQAAFTADGRPIEGGNELDLSTGSSGVTIDPVTGEVIARGGAAPGAGGGAGRSAPGASSGPAGSSGGPGGPAGSGGGTSAQGVTDGTIKIGLAFDRNAGSLNTAFGFAGVGQVDQKMAQDLMLEYINANGGVAGRMLEAVYYEGDSLSGKTVEQTSQEICATWTQDNEIFAAFGIGTDTLNACLNDAGVVQTGTGLGLLSSNEFERFPFIVEIGSPATDTLGQLLVEDMVAQDFYDEGRVPETAALPYKIGLIAYDDASFVAGAESLRTALGQNGLELADEVFITRAASAEDIGREANDIRAAVLRFKEQNITHVHFLQTGNAFLGFTFWQNADTQQYYPRYGLTSGDAAQALIPTMNSASPGSAGRTFEMAVGVGFKPLFDVPRADYSGDDESLALRQCKQIIEPASDGGYDDPARNKEAIAAQICDTALYFQAAMDAGGAVVNTSTWLQGVSTINELGSAGTFLLRTPNQRDAPGAVRSLAYFEDCSCFHYTSEQRRV